MINKKKYVIFGVIFLLVISILGTLAWYTFGTKKSSLVLVIGNSNQMLITLKPYDLNIVAAPTTNYTSLTDYVTVTVSNNKTVESGFKFYYDIESIDSNLISSAMKYAVRRSTSQNGTYTEVATGSFTGASNGLHKIIYTENVPAGTTYYYRVYTYLDGNSSNSNQQNKVLKTTIGAEFVETIYDYIENNADRTTVIDYSQTSAQDGTTGIYTYKGTNTEGPYPIYFYRGAVTNNNVKFANKCWKMVRTTGTGGVKLIYNGTYSDSTKCNNTGDNTLVSRSAYNSSLYALAYMGYMYGEVYHNSGKYMTSISESYKYGSGFTWDGSNYTLTDTISFAGTAWSSNNSRLTNYHYTCFNTSGTCSTLYYIYCVNSSYAMYIQLNNGKNIEDSINESLANSSNVTNSTIKALVDSWYSSNMTSYTSKIEDTSYCNDRSIYTYGGWLPNGNITSIIYFGAYSRSTINYNPSISCNKNDSFNVNDTVRGNGKLTYPVGLINVDEIMLAGGKAWTVNTNMYLYSNSTYWTMTPYNQGESYAYIWMFASTGELSRADSSTNYAIRPVVSLKYNNVISSGTGTVSDPFVVN